MKSITSFFRSRKGLFFLLLSHFQWLLSDSMYVKLSYRINMGKKLNLKNPETYNEKLNWIKLYDHNPLYTMLVDKYAVKTWVEKIIGQQFIIPTIGVWNSFDEIDFGKLPDSFVLKTTHGGGSVGVVICKEKKQFDKALARKKIERSMKISGYDTLREWPYKNVVRRIIAEPYLEDKETGELTDYKFFCFNGTVKAMFVGTERGKGDVKFDFFDEDYNHLDLVQLHPMSSHPRPKPRQFELMKELASRLSEGIPHVRVDLYECDGNVYFGELTFFHHGGVVPFHPESWDYIFGSWLQLPEKRV